MRPRPILKWIGISFVGPVIVLCAGRFLNPEEDVSPWTPYLILAGLLYFALLYGVWLPFRTKRLFLQQKTLQEPYEVEITDEAYSASSCHGQSRMVWKDFHKHKMSARIILLYQSDVLYHLFPTRWFSEDQLAEFQKILRANLGEPKA